MRGGGGFSLIQNDCRFFAIVIQGDSSHLLIFQVQRDNLGRILVMMEASAGHKKFHLLSQSEHQNSGECKDNIKLEV